MPIYWGKNVGGVHEANSDTQEDDEGCQTQKPQMKNDENKEQITYPTINTIFIFNLQKNNNCSIVGFGMQKFTNDMSRVLRESTIVFILSLGLFA